MGALRPVLLLILTATLVGCASGGPRNGPLPPRAPRTTVRVENHNFSDMTVYVLRGPQRMRLGTATGASTTVLRIPDALVFSATTLRFQIDPLGSRQQAISHDIMANPGDEVVLIIP